MTIDLNCDMGEGFDTDALIMPFISSANIACGAHAGDDTTMLETIQLAKRYDVAIGAHPSYPDRENFGRKEMNLSLAEIFETVYQQVMTIKKIAEKENCKLHHVKPHGALYNTSAIDERVALMITKAIKLIDASLKVYGLPSSALERACAEEGLLFYGEGFADRTYTNEGKLTPRSAPNALIEKAEDAVQQVYTMIEQQQIQSTQGSWLNMPVKTICIHGDGKHAVEFAQAIHQALKEKNISIQH